MRWRPEVEPISKRRTEESLHFALVKLQRELDFGSIEAPRFVRWHSDAKLSAGPRQFDA
jgi:hypothetical protein